MSTQTKEDRRQNGRQDIQPSLWMSSVSRVRTEIWLWFPWFST